MTFLSFKGLKSLTNGDMRESWDGITDNGGWTLPVKWIFQK